MIDRSFKVIACIADVHIGNKAISWKEYKYQLKHGIIEKLKAINFLDGIVICGDTTHYQISLNSEYANVFQWFISKIVKIAMDHGAFIRIIKGTKSHDLDQLENLRHYEDIFDLDFKIVNDYMIEEIDGHNYAYIAENYIKDPIDVYYKDIFSKPNGYFDMIFLHGMIEPCQFVHQDSENINTNAPVFRLKDLYKVCKGTIQAGHIHTPMTFQNKFFYVGSALRTCHGEEEDKGFNIVTYIQNKGVYRVDKIVNEFTFIFRVLELSNLFIETNDIDHIVDYIENYIEKHKVDRLSLKVTCIEKEETCVKIELLKKYFAKNPSITSNFKILSEKSYEKEIQNIERKEKKEYLKDNLDIVERIRLWALVERNYKLNPEDIMRFISPKTLERKEVSKSDV